MSHMQIVSLLLLGDTHEAFNTCYLPVNFLLMRYDA